MKNILIILLTMLIVLWSCETPISETPGSTTVEKSVINPETGETQEIQFSTVPELDQVLFNEWVYVNNNNDEWIELDLESAIGNDSHECICIIRIASVEGVEGGGNNVTEYVNGEIRKPDPLLAPYGFHVYKDVQEYEVILIADDNGKLQVRFDFGWPYEKRQRVFIKVPLYAKTK